MKIAMIIVGIFGGLCALCCAGGIGIWFFSINMLNTVVAEQFQDHPIVMEKIGDIEQINMNFWASVEEKDGAGGDERFVFDVSGPHGSGQLIVYDQVGDRFNGGILRTGGRDYDVSD